MPSKERRACPKAFADLEARLAERRAAGLSCALYRATEQVMIDTETNILHLRIWFVFEDGTGCYIDSTEPFPTLLLARELYAAGLSKPIQLN